MRNMAVYFYREFVLPWWNWVFPRRAESLPMKPIRKPRKKRETGESDGALYYLGDLLDQMEVYFKAMGKLREMDKDSYSFFRRVGGQVCNDKTSINREWLEKFWIKTRPSFGMGFFFNESCIGTEYLPVTMIYFRKIKCPYHVQRISPEVFHVGVIGSDNDSKKGGFAGLDYYLTVDEAGTATLLKQVNIDFIHVGEGQVRRKSFGYPRQLVETWDVRPEEQKHENIEDWAIGNFITCANLLTQAQAGIRVFAKNGKDGCAFNIDMLRTPYFFKDRDRVVNQNGNSRKIFHIVRAHRRGSKFVKTHFRGLRRFNWNGYEIEIKNPKSALKVFDFNVKAEEVVTLQDEIPEGMLSPKKVGDFIQKEFA